MDKNRGKFWRDGIERVPINSRRAAVALALLWLSPVVAAFETGKLSFTVNVDGLRSAYSEFFTTAMPEGSVSLSLESGAELGDIEVVSNAGRLVSTTAGRWHWSAPSEPGLNALQVRRKSSGERMRIHVFVLVPAGDVRNGRLNGYRIGTYPERPHLGLAIYKPPRGFIEVTEANKATRVSPHFTLEQFLCKQESAYPKYLVLRPRLLLKLEGLLEEVNNKGIATDGFIVMSGYRTPFYNRAINNGQYSRHVWGGAADIFIDVKPRDGRMDDLNRDGHINKGDATVLYHWVDQYDEKHGRPELVGGIGSYGSTADHGPFVHIDVRGRAARWGINE